MFAKNLVVSLSNGDMKSPPDETSEKDSENHASLVLWFQEHSVLCNAVTTENQWTPETHQRWKDCLLASTQKGRRLIQDLASDKVEQVFFRIQEANSQNSLGTPVPFAAASNISNVANSGQAQFVPVAGSSRGKSAIPLSGFRRFEEQMSFQGRPSGQAPHVGSSANSSGTFSGVGQLLVPSRTYIKKTGN